MKIKNIPELIFLIAIFFMPVVASAEENRSYFYENISQNFTVNPDTSVDVEETQTYNFTGEYHKGWRSIPLNKVSDIRDITVLDGETFVPLQYASRPLDKEDISSWGKYTYQKNGRNLEIEWYYKAANESRTWVLKYKLIGALSFLKDKDELYWNLFTDYDVPVRFVKASVELPENNLKLDSFQATMYSNDKVCSVMKGNLNCSSFPFVSIQDGGRFSFQTFDIQPYDKVTIAAGWPKGLVDRGAFWRQFFAIHYALIFSIVIIIATVLFMIVYWYFTEKKNKGRGTIIPEYAPPKHLPPAMAELIVKERLTSGAWAATVIDLAVRGYVKITEEEQNVFLKKIISFLSVGIIAFLFISTIFFFSLNTIFTTADNKQFTWQLIIPFIPLIILWLFFKRGRPQPPKNYLIESIKPFTEDPGLRDYERKFLTAILPGGRFSTKEMKTNVSASRKLYQAMKNIKEEMYEETEIETKAYEKPISKEKYLAFGFIAIFFLLFILIPAGEALSDVGLGFIAVMIVAIVCVIAIRLQNKYEARLSAEGAILREEWLGFKLYLETAERYRLQNLTPDIFEKYLPYAIIFGVEKKWGKAFAGLSMPPPNWYSSTALTTSHGAYAGSLASAGSPSNFSSGFSASAFSASFASSFSSAFASSGGGGASGGGGGAGGGGGGGGGGAS